MEGGFPSKSKGLGSKTVKSDETFFEIVYDVPRVELHDSPSYLGT